MRLQLPLLMVIRATESTAHMGLKCLPAAIERPNCFAVVQTLATSTDLRILPRPRPSPPTPLPWDGRGRLPEDGLGPRALSAVPAGLFSLLHRDPTMNRGAIFGRPSGTLGRGRKGTGKGGSTGAKTRGLGFPWRLHAAPPELGSWIGWRRATNMSRRWRWGRTHGCSCQPDTGGKNQLARAPVGTRVRLRFASTRQEGRVWSPGSA